MDVFPVFRLLIPAAYILYTNKKCFSENLREAEAFDYNSTPSKKMTIDSRATTTDELMRTNDSDAHIAYSKQEQQYREMLKRKNTMTTLIPEEEDEDYYDEEMDGPVREMSNTMMAMTRNPSRSKSIMAGRESPTKGSSSRDTMALWAHRNSELVDENALFPASLLRGTSQYKGMGLSSNRNTKLTNQVRNSRENLPGTITRATSDMRP